MAENTLPAPTGASLPQLPARLAGPIGQVKGLIGQPAVRKSLPAVGAVGMIGLAAMAWSMIHTPPQRMLFQGLSDADKAAMVDALGQAKIATHIDQSTGTLTVSEDDYYKARMLLAQQNLPKEAPGGYQILDQLPLGVSRAVEGERLRQARETELARSIEEIDGVTDARVHLAMPEQSVFVRDSVSPSASVVVRLAGGRELSDAQVRSIVNLVASSVAGMKPDAVTVVDGAGELLSKPGAGDGSDDGDRTLDAERKMESKVRDQLTQMLTPLVGAGNFTSEVQADINLDESQATRESYDKDGGALKAEQGSWTGNQAGDPQNAGGIPGALSNTPPPPATAVPGQPQPAANGASGAAAPGQPPANASQAAATSAAQPAGSKQSDTFTRAFELGKEISVTRAAPGAVKRLSVAVVVRDGVGGKKRSPAEIDQLTNLVRAAVGFNQQRGDVVTVVARDFAGADDVSAKQPWYETGWFAMLARNLTAIVIAGLVLLLGVRPLVKALLKGRGADPAATPAQAAAAEATDAAEGEPSGVARLTQSAKREEKAQVSLDMLDNARSYEDKVTLVKEFTREHPNRAALAVREMIKS